MIQQEWLGGWEPIKSSLDVDGGVLIYSDFEGNQALCFSTFENFVKRKLTFSSFLLDKGDCSFRGIYLVHFFFSFPTFFNMFVYVQRVLC